MNIGSLYLVKKYFWMLFPTKETVARAHRKLAVPVALAAWTAHADPSPSVSRIWSRSLNCEVTYFSPNEHIVFLEEEDKFKKVLTSDGRIGWTWVHENYNDYFEEVKEE